MAKPKDNAIEIETCCGMKEGGKFSPTLEVWVSQCCVCRDYYDPETKEKIETLPEGAQVTHFYCPSCFDAAMVAMHAHEMEQPGPRSMTHKLSEMKRSAN